jgi:hypothetical protein
MNLGLIILIVAGLILMIIIVVSVINSKKKKRVNFIDPLNQFAGELNAKISHFEIWNNSIIGIDEEQNLILAIQKTTGGNKRISVYLAEIQKCRVAEISRLTASKEGNSKAFDRIDLVFMNKEKSKSDVSIEIYNADTDRLTLAGELQLANKWNKIVNDKIAAFK